MSRGKYKARALNKSTADLQAQVSELTQQNVILARLLAELNREYNDHKTATKTQIQRQVEELTSEAIADANRRADIAHETARAFAGARVAHIVTYFMHGVGVPAQILEYIDAIREAAPDDYEAILNASIHHAGSRSNRRNAIRRAAYIQEIKRAEGITSGHKDQIVEKMREIADMTSSNNENN